MRRSARYATPTTPTSANTTRLSAVPSPSAFFRSSDTARAAAADPRRRRSLRGGTVHLLQHGRADLVGDGVHQLALTRRAHRRRRRRAGTSASQRRRDGQPSTRSSHGRGVALQARQHRAGRLEVVRLRRPVRTGARRADSHGAVAAVPTRNALNAVHAAAHGTAHRDSRPARVRRLPPAASSERRRRRRRTPRSLARSLAGASRSEQRCADHGVERGGGSRASPRQQRRARAVHLRVRALSCSGLQQRRAAGLDVCAQRRLRPRDLRFEAVLPPRPPRRPPPRRGTPARAHWGSRAGTRARARAGLRPRSSARRVVVVGLAAGAERVQQVIVGVRHHQPEHGPAALGLAGAPRARV